MSGKSEAMKIEFIRKGRPEPTEDEWIKIHTVEELAALFCALSPKDGKKLMTDFKNCIEFIKSLSDTSASKKPLRMSCFKWIND